MKKSCQNRANSFYFLFIKFKASGVGRMSEQLSRRITTIVTLKKFRFIEYNKSTTEEVFILHVKK